MPTLAPSILTGLFAPLPLLSLQSVWTAVPTSVLTGSDGFDGCNGFNSACCTQKVAEHGFGGVHAQMAAGQNVSDGSVLCHVSCFGGGCMSIHVVDLVSVNARLRQCPACRNHTSSRVKNPLKMAVACGIKASFLSTGIGEI